MQPEDVTTPDRPPVDLGPTVVGDTAMDLHVTRLDEQGPFVVASCTCGWRSYARRSRPLARSEAHDHELLHTAATA